MPLLLVLLQKLNTQLEAALTSGLSFKDKFRTNSAKRLNVGDIDDSQPSTAREQQLLGGAAAGSRHAMGRAEAGSMHANARAAAGNRHANGRAAAGSLPFRSSCQCDPRVLGVCGCSTARGAGAGRARQARRPGSWQEAGAGRGRPQAGGGQVRGWALSCWQSPCWQRPGRHMRAVAGAADRVGQPAVLKQAWVLERAAAVPGACSMMEVGEWKSNGAWLKKETKVEVPTNLQQIGPDDLVKVGDMPPRPPPPQPVADWAG